MGRAGRTGASHIAERDQSSQRGQPFLAPDTPGAPDIADAEQPAATHAMATVTAPVSIERMILHHLDNRTGKLLLVEAELALDADIHALFASYITQALDNADWQARFLADQTTMPDLCATLLREPTAFVDVSHQMARRLFAQMRQRPNQINSGDFVVAVYSANGSPASSIALFKLDPDERLVRNFSTEHGRRLVRISLAHNVMPATVRQKQKCALITPSSDGADFSVALLDTIANIRSEGVAAFFYRGFLATQILPSARRRTRLFLRSTDDWLADHGVALTPRALFQFYQARREALAGALLDLPAFVLAALPTDAGLAADLLAYVTKNVFDADLEPDQTRFTVDRATADPVVRMVTLELDGGARLSIPAERFAEMARIDDQRTGGKIRLTIETLTLKEGAAR